MRGNRLILKTIISVIVVILLLAGMVVFYLFNPETHAFFPRCMFNMLTGLQCPGCGTQRAIHSLLHGDFRSAFAYNALMLLLVPYIFLGVYVAFLGGRERFPKLEEVFFGKWAAIVAICTILIYWVLRNVF